MADMCYNHFNVAGDITDIIKFIDENYSVDEEGCYGLDFNKVIPIPDDIDENDYEWRKENWGTVEKIDDLGSIAFKMSKDEEDINILKQDGNPTIQEDTDLLLYENEFDEGDKMITTSTFYTPWTTCDKVYDGIREKYKDDDLKFVALYHEHGSVYAGKLAWSKGEYKVKEHHDVNTKEEYEKYIEFCLNEGLHDPDDLYEDIVEGYGINYDENGIKEFKEFSNEEKSKFCSSIVYKECE